MWSQILLETLLRMPSPPINKHKDLTIDEFEQNYRCTDAITCLSSNHPSLMHIQTRICRAHQGDHGHAMAYYEAALIIYKLWLDEDDPWRTYLIANMARSALDLGDDKKAHQIL
ncbi:unnamed protein product [Rotaria sp. Silwood1]|nr:unnamed protein product [Rotaria sp. Silwood1]CAF1625824.1 unnamed protein product [Rotaria sp. Silwood1]CAF3831409.1 unnamed protein product [Rotaria sp. Silwood1]